MIQKNRTHYINRKYQGYQLWILPEYNDDIFVQQVCITPSQWSESFTRINSSENARVFYFEWQGKGFFLKQYLQRNWLESLKDIFRGNRSRRTWRNHAMLEENGFIAPRIILTGKNGFLNFTVFESIAHFLNLRRYMEKMVSELPAAVWQTRKNILITDLGHTVGKMHHKAISHGDLRWGNIHVDDTQGDHFQFHFIDNERTERHLFLPMKIRLKNLVQLNVIPNNLASRRDSYRFFSAYLQENPELIPYKHQLVKNILRKTNHRMKQKQQRKNKA